MGSLLVHRQGIVPHDPLEEVMDQSCPMTRSIVCRDGVAGLFPLRFAVGPVAQQPIEGLEPALTGGTLDHGRPVILVEVVLVVVAEKVLAVVVELLVVMLELFW